MAPLCHAEKFLSIPRAFLMKELHIPDRGLLSAFFTARYFVVVTGVGSWFMLPTSRVKGLGKCQRVFFSRERRQSCPPPPMPGQHPLRPPWAQGPGAHALSLFVLTARFGLHQTLDSIQQLQPQRPAEPQLSPQEPAPARRPGAAVL